MKPDEHSSEQPEIFALQRGPRGWAVTRRDFIAASTLASGAAVIGLPAPAGAQTSAAQAGAATDCTNIPAHTAAIRALAMDPAGELLVSAGEDKRVKVWRLTEGSHVLTLNLDYSARAVALAVRAGLIYTAGGEPRVRSWDLASGEARTVIEGHEKDVLAMALTREEHRLITVAADQRIRIWTLPEAALANETNPFADMSQLALDPTGLRFAVDAWNSFANVRLINDGSLACITARHGGAITAMAFHPDGGLLATAADDRKVRLWETEGGAEIRAMAFTGKPLRALAFLEKGAKLAGAGEDHGIRIWNTGDGAEATTLTGHTGAIRALAANADGTLLASAGDDKTIRVWNWPGGSLRACLLDLEAAPKTVQGIQVETVNTVGQRVTSTLPCGSPIPTGAVCVCNCVPGRAGPACSCVGHVVRPSATRSHTYHYWHPN